MDMSCNCQNKTNLGASEMFPGRLTYSIVVNLSRRYIKNIADFLLVSSQSVTANEYPMPRIDHVIDGLGKAKYSHFCYIIMKIIIIHHITFYKRLLASSYGTLE